MHMCPRLELRGGILDSERSAVSFGSSFGSLEGDNCKNDQEIQLADEKIPRQFDRHALSDGQPDNDMIMQKRILIVDDQLFNLQAIIDLMKAKKNFKYAAKLVDTALSGE